MYLAFIFYKFTIIPFKTISNYKRNGTQTKSNLKIAERCDCKEDWFIHVELRHENKYNVYYVQSS